MIIVIIVWLVFALIAANIASQKGLSAVKFFLLSVALTPIIGLAAAIAASPKTGNAEAVQSKTEESIKTIAIGAQVWMAQNLNVSTFRNGDPIPEAKTREEWEQAGGEGTPAWCYYDNDPDNAKKYGKLYNWFAVNDPRGLAPEEWCIPGEDDFALLLEECAREDVTAYHALIKGSPSGFSSVFGGWRHSNGTFYSLDLVASYWTATPGYDNDAYRLNLSNKNENADMDTIYYSLGLSVRCLKG